MHVISSLPASDRHPDWMQATSARFAIWKNPPRLSRPQGDRTALGDAKTRYQAIQVRLMAVRKEVPYLFPPAAGEGKRAGERSRVGSCQRSHIGKLRKSHLFIPQGCRAYNNKAGLRCQRRGGFRFKALAPPDALIDETMGRIIFKMKNPLRPDDVRRQLAQCRR
jgi:hypothetical protein